MFAKEFYQIVISSEECVYAFLKEHKILNSAQKNVTLPKMQFYYKRKKEFGILHIAIETMW